MKLKEIYSSKSPVISYEIFPPKIEKPGDDEKISVLMSELAELKKFNPAFISVTYGAGGSTRERTFELVLKIKNELSINTMPHFTCVGATRDEIMEYLSLIQSENIENILALRGDPPKGETNFVKPENGFGYANELVEFIKINTNLSIAVAGYPEIHPEAESFETDIENLKRKVDMGGELIITQLFFDNSCFYRFIDKVEKAGIKVPVIPGIFPIINTAQTKRLGLMCKNIPDKLIERLEKAQDNPDEVRNVGIQYAVDQCLDLVANNVAGLHFYTFNKAFATKVILEELKIGALNPV